MPVHRTNRLPAAAAGEPTTDRLRWGSAKTAHPASAGAKSPEHSYVADSWIPVADATRTLPQAGAPDNSISQFGEEQTDARCESVHEILATDRSQLALSKEASQRNWPECAGDCRGVVMGLRKHARPAPVAREQ